MWNQQLKNKYKTKDPNLIITAVCCFPNINTTVESMDKECQTAENQADPIRLDIEGLYWRANGRDFIPIAFENKVPKLAKLNEVKPLGKGFFYCIGYKTPLVEIIWEKQGCSSIRLPKHEKWLELLNYSLEKLNGFRAYYLFKECVKNYIYEQTENFTDFQKTKRFVQIENVELKCLQPKNYKDKIELGEMITFIEKMKSRSIYEFMFNEFNPGRY